MTWSGSFCQVAPVYLTQIDYMARGMNFSKKWSLLITPCGPPSCWPRRWTGRLCPPPQWCCQWDKWTQGPRPPLQQSCVTWFLFSIKIITSPPCRITSVNPSLSEINMTPSHARRPETNNSLPRVNWYCMLDWFIVYANWRFFIVIFVRHQMMDALSVWSVKESWKSAYFHSNHAHHKSWTCYDKSSFWEKFWN